MIRSLLEVKFQSTALYSSNFSKEELDCRMLLIDRSVTVNNYQ